MELGGEITSAHQTLANLLRKLAEAGGTYHKKYETNEERVLHRHLNLYINKRRDAKTDAAKDRWTGKIAEQRAKIQRFNGELDLDGL